MSKKLALLQSDPAAFRRSLLIDTDDGPARFATRLEPWQLADFTAMDPAWRSVCGQAVDVPHRRFWCERPRGHSKTTDLAVMLAWVLFASPRKITGVCAAADSDQAKLLRDAVSKLLSINAWLAAYLDVQSGLIRNKKTGSECKFISSDAPSSYGLTPDFVVCDELTHWASRDLWDSLVSSAAKRERCLLAVILNAGWQDTWQWETRQAIRNSPEWHFSRLESPAASWITAKTLDEQKRLLPPVAYARLWLNQWAPAGAGDAIDPADIEACVTLDGPTSTPEESWAYIVGADLGIKHDATAVVTIGVHVGHVEEIVRERPQLSATQRILAAMNGVPAEDEYEYVRHEGTYRLKLIDVWIRRPEPGRRVDLEEVEAAIEARCRKFNAVAVIDFWQAESLTQRLEKAGVAIEAVQLSWSSLQAAATAVLDCFRDKTIDLYREPTLLADLRSLQIQESRLGYRLTAPRVASGQGTRHADSASALQLAIWGGRRYATRPAIVEGPLVCWPE